MFERTKAKIRLHRICKALGVEPYPEMVRYVIDRDETIFRGGRRNGKTLALIIDELVCSSMERLEKPYRPGAENTGRAYLRQARRGARPRHDQQRRV